MNTTSTAWALILHELQSVTARLEAQKPFAMQMPMVTAAGVSDPAQAAIETHMLQARQKLRRVITRFEGQLQNVPQVPTNVRWAQHRLSMVKLQFQSVLARFEIFGEVLSQRAQHDTGLWLAGLDVAALSALHLPYQPLPVPPVVCYVDRSHGGAIRRAQTPLPGGGSNPVAIVRMPRERMVGTGIAASLFHEVGHQAAAVLGLVTSLRDALHTPIRELAERDAQQAWAWRCWQSWVSEWVADLWAVAQAGVTASVGLIGVVSLPSVFVYRYSQSDPHPAPWIRVMLSLALGEALYPDPQWESLRQAWAQLYPRSDMNLRQQRYYSALEQSLGPFVSWLLALRLPALQDLPLGQALRWEARSPAALRQLGQELNSAPLEQLRLRNLDVLLRMQPAHALAVLGQARHDGRLAAYSEFHLTSEILNRWAMDDYLPRIGSRSHLDVIALPESTPAAMAATFH
jgi:hypothetical protein